MSTNEQTPLSQPTFAVRNTSGKEQDPQGLGKPASDTALREYYNRNYHKLLPIIAEKVHQEKVQQERLKAVKARLNFEETSQHSESGTPSRRTDLKKRLGSKHARGMSGSPESRRDRSKSPRKKDSKRRTMFKRLEKGVFHRLGDKGKKKQSLLSKNVITKEHPHVGRKRYRKAKVAQEDIGSQSQRGKSRVLRTTCPNQWVCKETNPFTPRIRYFDFLKTRMPSHIKTYDGSEDPEDHLKIFQAVAKTERWAMPTWCHMFNSTLTGNARVWFDDLPKEYIDSYDELKDALLEKYFQRKKCIKDPVEIHNIKQRDGESTEEGEVAASNRERNKSFSSWKQQEAGQKPNFKKASLRNQQRPKRKQGRFTILTKTPKEILALDKGKFKPPPPMKTPNQIEKMLKAGKLSHLIKELKQNNGKDHAKAAKKGETSGKKKPLAILMVQPWQTVAKQMITQTFFPESVKEIPKKGQNRIKTEQKREAWRSREKSKAVTVERGRKTKENKKGMNENANTSKKLFKFKEKKKRRALKSNKPPDPLIKEFCVLTKLTLPKDIRVVPMDEFRAKVGRGRPKKSVKGVKIKARERVESSLVDSRGGKHVVTTPINNELDKVLSDLRSGSINGHLKFAIGRLLSFLLDYNPIGNQNRHVAKSSGLKACYENIDMGDVGSIGVDQTSPIDGIASVKTGNGLESGLASPYARNEHTGMEDVVSNSVVPSSTKDGIASYKDGMDFEFGKNDNSNGLLKKPIGPLFSGWNDGGVKAFKPTILSNQFSGVVDRVVRDNLMRMWRIHEIKDITKTNSGIFYIKFKCEDGMKTVLVSGPWMAGKLDFARVLVEVSANEDLPSVLEIAYPPLENRPARIGKLDVKYQWKPSLCTHCKTFGHTTLACKIRPRTEEELVAASTKQCNIMYGVSIINEDGNGKGDDGFVTVGKRNRPVSNGSKNASGGQSKVMQGGNFQSYNMKKSFAKQGSFAAGYVKNNFINPGGVNQVKNPMKDNSNAEGQKKFVQKSEYRVKISAPSKPKSLQQISKDPNFKPKVLLRGSTSKNSPISVFEQAIPIKNSFQLLVEEDMDQSNLEGGINVQEEFDSKVWPALKEEVDILMEAGIYPSKAVRLDWTIHQMDYFYKNCHKFYLDPSFEDDDVDFEKDGIASDIQPEFETSAAVNSGNIAASLQKCKRSIQDEPWVILGDFSATLDPFKKFTDGSKITTAMGDFKDYVSNIGMEDISMSSLRFTWNKKPVSKLEMLKKPLRKLNFDQGSLFEKVKVLRNKLADIQSDVSADPHSDVLREAELKCFNDYNATLRDEESFLRKKAKIEWLKEGDRNSRSFHVCLIEDHEALFHKKISFDDAYMVRYIYVDEIKSALFNINGNKVPGSDGFSSYFFKSSWAVIGEDLCKAVKEFFISCKLLKEVNSIIVVLVPKSSTPKLVSDYRPIACCNVVYKIISKIIVGRIKNFLGDLVDINQSAFIPNRQISDNNLLSQELMRGYHHNDLMLFCHEDRIFVFVLKKALDEFGMVSGLLPSLSKSMVFF
nr:hypothetical protein [Tanacetum cinerariifolium]